MGIMASMALIPVCRGSVHGLTLGDAGGDLLDWVFCSGYDLALTIDRLTQSVDHAAYDPLADRYRQDLAGSGDLLPLDYRLLARQEHDSHLGLL
jgi:hypothetical protein